MNARMLLAVTTLVAFAACGSGESEGSDATSTGGAGEGSDGVREVEMRLIAFKPQALDVPRGTTVRWSQEDAGFHTVTSGEVEVDGSGNTTFEPDERFDSGQLAKGKAFSFTFDDAGKYPYFCEIHPATMRGEVTVR